MLEEASPVNGWGFYFHDTSLCIHCGERPLRGWWIDARQFAPLPGGVGLEISWFRGRRLG
ncbi:MAG: hypothetical protein KAJ53_02790 [Anaerolineales bacterium]|nr:hypothetical protein [Anaerolineales bacterium]